jgi:NAD+ synthase
VRDLPAVHLPLLAEVLQQFLAGELAASGLAGYVVGLSGGIDSAVSATLAVRAVGATRVIAMALPGPTSDPRSLADAEEVASWLGVPLELRDLSQPAAQLAAVLGCGDDRLRFGNLLARLRMTALFDRARPVPALVLGTSNKSEILLGYSTLFGDSAASVQPLGDVWKTQVFALAEYLDLPQRVRSKPPTADLWPGQTDAGELGFDYRDADPILWAHHEAGLDPGQLLAAGFDPPLVRHVLALYRRNRFKWRPTVVARVSSSAINIDRILPRNPEP